MKIQISCAEPCDYDLKIIDEHGYVSAVIDSKNHGVAFVDVPQDCTISIINQKIDKGE